MVTLSSAEAELVAATKTACEGRGNRNMLIDYGSDGKVQPIVGASAAIGMMERRGLGTTKHVDTKWMWIQGAIRRREIQLLKVGTKDNPADLMTKFLIKEDAERHLDRMGYRFTQ